MAVDGGISFYGESDGKPEPVDFMKGFFAGRRSDDYYRCRRTCQNPPRPSRPCRARQDEAADAVRTRTTVGYGPRLLHSTGQYHKGGPNNGLFIQITADDPLEVPIPGASMDLAPSSRLRPWAI